MQENTISTATVKEMKSHIHEKLKSRSSHIQGEIYNYIEMKDINHTKNANGIFVNISTLDDEYVKDIYTMICYHKQHTEIPIQPPEVYENAYEKTPIQYQLYTLTSFQERLVNLICNS